MHRKCTKITKHEKEAGINLYRDITCQAKNYAKGCTKHKYKTMRNAN